MFNLLPFVSVFLMAFGSLIIAFGAFGPVLVEGDISVYQARKLMIVVGFLMITFGNAMGG